MGNTFKGGKDRPHRKVVMNVPHLGREFSQWLVQVCQVDKEYGPDIARQFVSESEKKFNLSKGELSFALSLIGVKS